MLVFTFSDSHFPSIARDVMSVRILLGVFFLKENANMLQLPSFLYVVCSLFKSLCYAKSTVAKL